MEPAMAAVGSVVGLPALSNAQCAGMGCPVAAAVARFTKAVAEDDESRISGAPVRGAAIDQGFVPKNGVRPPHGAMVADALANISAISPRLANRPVK